VLLLRAETPADGAQALEDARLAYSLLPWVPFVCDVLGAAEVEGGRLDEGLARLDEADGLDVSRQEAGARNAWRALAHARAGDGLRARRWLREARTRGLEVGPPPALLRRAEEALRLAPD
jgi:hypothetical protein